MDREFQSTEYCMMPNLVTTENMGHGWQYYQTTMHIIGAEEITQPGDCYPVIKYKNPYVDCTVCWSSIKYYKKNTAVFYVEIKGKKYYGSDGNAKKLPFYDEMGNDGSGPYWSKLVSQRDFEEYLLKKIKG